MRRIAGIIAVLFLLAIPIYANDYYIEAYDVRVDVRENNVLQIEEKIKVYFNEERHGIYRKIPTKNRVERLDGTRAYTYPIISDRRSNEESNHYQEGNYEVIKIGDPDKVVTGEKEYSLSYTYDLGADTGKGYDELYLNIIGTEWDTTIDGVKFEINMPKVFDKTQVGFSVGEKGSTNSDNIQYEVNGNSILGSYDKKLKPGEGITIRIQLPEGYYVGTRSNSRIIEINLGKMSCIPFISLGIVFILWLIWGRTSKVNIHPTAHPPLKVNSAEAAMIYRGKANNKDVVSLLYYLANRGYIRIIELPKERKRHSHFRIEKLREYSGQNEAEKKFMEGLFYKREEVEEKELVDKFYITINKVRKEVNSGKLVKSIFTVTSVWSKRIGMCIAATSYVVVMAAMYYYYGNFEELLRSLIFGNLGIIIILFCIFVKEKLSFKLLVGLIGTIFILSGGGMGLFGVISSSPEEAIIFVEEIACLMLMIPLINNMLRRTAYGNQVLEEILGYREFLEKSSKAEIQHLLEEKPEYPYEALAYMYALDIKTVKMRRFTKGVVNPPNWYVGLEWNPSSLHHSFNKTMDRMNRSMTSNPYSSSSTSGSSGGGFAGGGSGGGGGGSW